jgi:hypothetical protein
MDPNQPNNPSTPPATPAATPPAAPPAAPAFVNPDGTFADGWLQNEKIAPDLRKNKTIMGLKDVPTALAMLANAETVIGKKRLVLPENDQDTAALDAAFAALGRPESADKYPALQLPAGVTADESDKALRQWAHKHRLTSAQYLGLAQEILDWNLADQRSAQAKAAQAESTREAAERTAWGPTYDYNNQLVPTVAAAFLPADRLARLQQSGVLAHPDVRELLVQVGAAITPDRLHTNRGGGADTTSIEQKIAELEASPAYRQPGPQHEAVTQQVLQLRQQLINAKGGR